MWVGLYIGVWVNNVMHPVGPVWVSRFITSTRQEQARGNKGDPGGPKVGTAASKKESRNARELMGGGAGTGLGSIAGKIVDATTRLGGR